MNGDMAPGGARTVAGWLAAGLVVAALGCSGEQTQTTTTDAKADSTAYAQVRGVEDDAQRLAALRTFVKEHPSAKEGGRAFAEAIELAMEHEPASVEPLLKEFAKKDFPESSVYNSIGWNLAERGEHLDIAVSILEKGVAKARVGGDKDELASILDSEAWARHKKGDNAVAVQRMEEAYQIIGPGSDEIDEHMARIYDAAGMGEKARPIYVSLLGHMEHPELRANLKRIVESSGGPMAEVEAEIRKLRAENMKDAPDFTGPSLADGSPLSVAGMRGKVVLLNFWHPT